MKVIFNKIEQFRKDQGDNFKLRSAIVVGILLLSFIGATIYVLLSSYAST